MGISIYIYLLIVLRHWWLHLWFWLYVFVDVFGIGFSNEFEWNLIVKIIIIMKMWFKKNIYDYVQQW
jgi:hypothetical protein